MNSANVSRVWKTVDSRFSFFFQSCWFHIDSGFQAVLSNLENVSRFEPSETTLTNFPTFRRLDVKVIFVIDNLNHLITAQTRK